MGGSYRNQLLETYTVDVHTESGDQDKFAITTGDA
ncbi:hypothetical protein BDD14_4360 [Edaphobacter modestus]|uniref:Uncharacterized protein n=1 Tax=Edaphobacter modestus TaxID=388466 RepID=A0A4Q7YZZ2_9BACT|nr:hypothetical protein BDD14_4360 [Edaphobacter modestus]